MVHLMYTNKTKKSLPRNEEGFYNCTIYYTIESFLRNMNPGGNNNCNNSRHMCHVNLLMNPNIL